MPSLADVRALLRSAIPNDKAWGAWWAANGRLRELEPELRANLEASLAAARTPVFGEEGVWNQMVLDATLDAFIQIGSDALPVDLIESVYAMRPDSGFILLAEPSRPESTVDPFLLKLVDDKGGDRTGMTWLAAADVLLTRHAPGLVAAVLWNLTFTAQVLVCDRPSPAGVPTGPVPLPFVSHSDGNACVARGTGYAGSWSTGGSAAGFPPWELYRLASPGPANSVLFVRGATAATSMAYRRYVGPPEMPEWGPRTTADRMAIVAAAAPGVPLPDIDGKTLSLWWQDDAAYRAAVEQFRAGLTHSYSEMIRALRADNLLTDAEVAELAVPHLEITVRDSRSHPTPLPAF